MDEQFRAGPGEIGDRLVELPGVGGREPRAGAEYGISSLVFRDDRPFHPGRLWDLVAERLDSGEFGTVLRSKGFFRLASRSTVTGLWSQAGSVARFEPAGMADAPGQPQQGQELVFIGTALRADALRAALTACLLEEAESCAAADDPFPARDHHVHVA